MAASAFGAGAEWNCILLAASAKAIGGMAAYVPLGRLPSGIVFYWPPKGGMAA